MGRIENIQFDATYYPVAVLSFTFFLYLFKYVSPSLSARLCPRFTQLSESKQIDWHSRVNSSLHATVVSALCVYTILYEKELNEEPIWWDSPMVRTSCAVVVGYMTSDAVLMAIHYKHIGEIFYFFHHGASIYAYYYVMVCKLWDDWNIIMQTYGVLPYFANYRLMAEISTPIVNQRWFFDALGYSKTHPVYISSGVLMTVTFFAVRIFTMPTYWHKVYSVYGTEDFLRLGHIQLVLVLTCFILDLLNLVWFYKMCRGVHKVVAAKFDKNRNITNLKLE